ncbi:hypothetical protein BGZ73_008967 [Actinomortierella ambigua]|nr:hypothetical protein BGZ73_008967 [Actinomortierella ambigua]
MEKQPAEQKFEDTPKELEDCLSWTAKACDMAWVMLPGTFDEDEFEKARMNGRAEEFVKSNCTFSAPFSQLNNKKTWVYRDVSNKSAQSERSS